MRHAKADLEKLLRLCCRSMHYHRFLSCGVFLNDDLVNADARLSDDQVGGDEPLGECQFTQRSQSQMNCNPWQQQWQSLLGSEQV
jgi:hypothetical protein